MQPGQDGPSFADRIRRRSSGRSRRTYWIFVLALAAVGVVFMLVKPARKPGPTIERPAVPKPEYRVLSETDVSSGRLERVNLVVLVRDGLPDDSVRHALNWAVFSRLEEGNLRQKRSIRVVWAYAVESETVPMSRWRGMAIWADRRLPGNLVPAHSGGDAVWVGDVEYDLTNPVLATHEPGRSGAAARQHL